MAKFCGKCGCKLDEQTGVCPNCTTMDENKRHNVVKIIVCLIILIVVVAATIFALLFLNYFGNCNGNKVNGTNTETTVPLENETGLDGHISVENKNSDTEKRAVISNGFGEFYNSGCYLFSLDSLESLEPLKCYDSSSSKGIYVGFSNYKTAYSEDAIYAQEGDITRELYKYKFTDAEKLERSVWVDEDTLKNSVVTPYTENGYSGNMAYFNKEGNYIYFICYPSAAYITTQRDIAFRLGRISANGDTIEFLNDEIASSYTVSNDWIYFYDNGYTYDNSLKDGFKIESNRSGIYKMKCDGSQKQLLLGDFTRDSRDNCTYNTLCDKMNIYGEYLYFVNYSESGESKLYRMKTDGSELECLTKNGVDEYTVDTKNNVIYYTDGQFGQAQVEGRSLYKVSIDNNIEEKIVDGAIMSDTEFSYYDNYIYFMNADRYIMGINESTYGTIGMRYDLIDGRTDLLKGYICKTTEIDSDGFPVTKISDPVLTFVEDSDTEQLY